MLCRGHDSGLAGASGSTFRAAAERCCSEPPLVTPLVTLRQPRGNTAAGNQPRGRARDTGASVT